MEKVKLYLKESVNELLYKVTWPTWEELQSSAIVVLIASMIIALIIYVMDTGAETTLGLFYDMLS
ncbi:MAG: preprotein translocase subunit SecE [Bacteroidetes bacterium]|nr:MAG: preprotein translocase subunit SecE [Bacteroidota bacterium]